MNKSNKVEKEWEELKKNRWMREQMERSQRGSEEEKVGVPRAQEGPKGRGKKEERGRKTGE